MDATVQRTLGKDNKRVEDFFLGEWARRRNLLDILRDIHTIRQWGATSLRTQVQKRFPLTEVNHAVALYQSNMTAGKVLLLANQREIPLNIITG